MQPIDATVPPSSMLLFVLLTFVFVVSFTRSLSFRCGLSSRFKSSHARSWCAMIFKKRNSNSNGMIFSTSILALPYVTIRYVSYVTLRYVGYVSAVWVALHHRANQPSISSTQAIKVQVQFVGFFLQQQYSNYFVHDMIHITRTVQYSKSNCRPWWCADWLYFVLYVYWPKDSRGFDWDLIWGRLLRISFGFEVGRARSCAMDSFQASTGRKDRPSTNELTLNEQRTMNNEQAKRINHQESTSIQTLLKYHSIQSNPIHSFHYSILD